MRKKPTRKRPYFTMESALIAILRNACGKMRDGMWDTIRSSSDVILTISYSRAQTKETSSLPTDSSRPLFKQIEIFSGILTVYFNCKYFP